MRLEQLSNSQVLSLTEDELDQLSVALLDARNNKQMVRPNIRITITSPSIESEIKRTGAAVAMLGMLAGLFSAIPLTSLSARMFFLGIGFGLISAVWMFARWRK